MSDARTRHHPTRPRRRRRPVPRTRSGFTLIETALATVIVGLGVIAIIAAQQAFHQQNGWPRDWATRSARCRCSCPGTIP